MPWGKRFSLIMGHLTWIRIDDMSLSYLACRIFGFHTVRVFCFYEPLLV